MEFNEEKYKNLSSKSKPRRFFTVGVATFLFVVSFSFFAVALALSALSFDTGGQVSFNASSHVYAKVSGIVSGTKTTNNLTPLEFNSTTTSPVTVGSTWTGIKFDFAAGEIVFAITFENLNSESSYYVTITDTTVPTNLTVTKKILTGDANVANASTGTNVAGAFEVKNSTSTENKKTCYIILTPTKSGVSVNGNLKFNVSLSNTNS